MTDNNETLVPVSITLEPEQVEQIDRIADKEHRTRSNLLRVWLGERLAEEKKQAKEKR